MSIQGSAGACLDKNRQSWNPEFDQGLEGRKKTSHSGKECGLRGITLESLEIETDGEIDLRGFLGIDPAVPPGYERLSYVVRIKGSGTDEEFAEIHAAVMAISPNFYNVSQAVALKPTLIVE